jgi:hypothetical protein
MVGGISSESRAGIPRNGGRHQFGIRILLTAYKNIGSLRLSIRLRCHGKHW